MQKYSLYKKIIAFAVVCLVAISFVAASTIAFAAPSAQQIRANEVTGTLPGGQFAKIWLGLEPETSGAQVTVVVEWDRNDPASQGLNFFILDEQGLRRIGEDSLSTIALAAGSSNFVLNGPANVLGASFNAIGLATYTIVVANDSNQDATFTLRATNALIVDDSGQVTNPNATPTAEGDTETAPGETAAVTETVTTTVVATTTAITESTVVTPAVTATPAATVATTTTTNGVARATTLTGNLSEQNAQHFIGLEPDGRDAQVTLRLTIEPQDSSELARRLNFWVLDANGFKQYLAGTDPSDVAIAAGNRVFRGQDNERVASFRVVGSGEYTVIVYNNATIPGSYELSIDGGVLVDDSGQTNESKNSGGTLTATGTVTTSTTTTGTTTAPAAATPAAEATTATTTRSGEPGGSYTVQSGDTLALIARDIYGDLNLYDEICAFNNLTDCNVIEVGDVIQLPTQAQISANARAATTATPTPAPTVAPTAAATTTTTIVESPAVTETATMTATETTTDTTSSETGTSTTAESNGAGATIYDTLVANGNFTTLVKGLEQAGLDTVLDGSGEYTLFAPTDAAFVALRNRFSLTEAQLLGLPELPDTMRYHVLSGSILSSDLTDGMTASTLQGKAVRFEVDGDSIKINGANIIAADVPASNGVIHVIDAVIIPPAD